MTMPHVFEETEEAFGFCARCVPDRETRGGWELRVLSARLPSAYDGDANVMHQPQPGRCLRCGVPLAAAPLHVLHGDAA